MQGNRPNTGGKPPKHHPNRDQRHALDFDGDDTDIMGLLDQPSKKDSLASGGLTGGINKLNSIEHDEDEEDYGQGIEYHNEDHSDDQPSYGEEQDEDEEEDGGTPDDYKE